MSARFTERVIDYFAKWLPCERYVAEQWLRDGAAAKGMPLDEYAVWFNQMMQASDNMPEFVAHMDEIMAYATAQADDAFAALRRYLLEWGESDDASRSL